MDLPRKSDRVRVSEAAVLGVQGSEVSHSSWGSSSRKLRLRKGGSTHVGYDTVLCILGRDPLEPAGLGGSRTADFTTNGERIDASNEQLELILVLRAISRAM